MPRSTSARRTTPAARPTGRMPDYARRVAELNADVAGLVEGFSADRRKAAKASAEARAEDLAQVVSQVESLRDEVTDLLKHVRKAHTGLARRGARDRAAAVASVQDWVGSLREELAQQSAQRRSAHQRAVAADRRDRQDAVADIRRDVHSMIDHFNAGSGHAPTPRTPAPQPSRQAASDSPAHTVQRLSLSAIAHTNDADPTANDRPTGIGRTRGRNR
jgi:hypothetical protein